jgi:hypothetical protein
MAIQHRIEGMGTAQCLQDILMLSASCREFDSTKDGHSAPAESEVMERGSKTEQRQTSYLLGGP